MDPSHPQHRSPPRGWEAAVAKLAKKRAEELGKVVTKLAAERPAGTSRKAAPRKRARKRAAARRR
jgi:hypothetical protein